GLTEEGVNVVDIGVVPTPVNYWALHNLGVEGGIQITGSHNPPEYNGFKLSLGTNSVHGREIERLYELTSVAAAEPESPATAPRAVILRHEPVIDRYLADIETRIGKLSRPIRMVYDCGNGAGSVVAPWLFESLGAHARGLFCESDGTFPNHHPDPTVPENL